MRIQDVFGLEGRFINDKAKYLDMLNSYPCWNNDGSCRFITIRALDLNSVSIFPTVVGMIKELAQKFHLPKIPEIWAFYRGDKKGSIDVASLQNGQIDAGILVSYEYLQKASDDELFTSFAHELMHKKQYYLKKNYSEITGNNQEAEADIASVLVNGYPVVDFVGEQSQLPIFTRSNVDEILKPVDSVVNGMINSKQKQGFGGDPYPSCAARVSLILTMNEYYKRAKELLVLTGEDQERE
jgi:hypothetical protein